MSGGGVSTIAQEFFQRINSRGSLCLRGWRRATALLSRCLDSVQTTPLLSGSGNPPIFGKLPRPFQWADFAQSWRAGRSLPSGSLHGLLEGGQHGYRVGRAALAHHADALPGLGIALVS